MAHLHEKIDFTVEVFIVHENAVLLRKHDKYKKWLSIGGHIELHEDPTEAALREVQEEVGLTVQFWDNRKWSPNNDEVWHELVPPVSIGRHNAIHPTVCDHEHVTLVYFGRSGNRDVRVSYEGDRSDEWRWFTREELEQLEDGLPDNVRRYALAALDELAS